MSETPDLRTAAQAVLDANRREGYTAPAPHLYPHQWLWDSCFIAIGLRHYDTARAKQEIESLLAAQWHDGMVPHMVFAPDFEYQADRMAWHSAGNPASPDHIATSGITQPPLLAEAVSRIGSKLPRAERIDWYRVIVPKVVRYHQWLYSARDPFMTGLVSCVHPWETGFDNTPAWMEIQRSRRLPVWLQVMAHIGLVGQFERFRRDTREIPADQRYETADALASFAAQRRLRALRYNDAAMLARGPFNVQDAAFNAMLIRNNALLLKLASAAGVTVPPGLRASFTQAKSAFQDLYDESTGHYFPRDLSTGNLVPAASIASLLALYSGSVSKERAAALVKMIEDEHAFGPDFPLPSVPVNSPYFNPKRYWQGPTWLNTNWLVADGLRRYGYREYAAALAEISLELTSKHGFYEYYHPYDGKPLGAQGFSWTAALTIDFMHTQ